MKLVAISALLSFAVSLVEGVPDATKAAFDMMKAKEALHAAIHDYQPGAADQPPCMDVAAGYYIFCIRIPEDYNVGKAVFTDHPRIPPGSSVESLGSSNAVSAVTAIFAAINTCPAVGDSVLATYDWDNDAGGDGTNVVVKTSLCQDFHVGGNHHRRGLKTSPSNEHVVCGIQVAETPKTV